MAKDKNLAEEYLNRKIKEAPFNSLTIDFEFAFSANHLIEAFNAGRESVIESASELKWEEIMPPRRSNGFYVDICKTHTLLGDFLITKYYLPKDIVLSGDNFPKRSFKTIEDAKSYATKVYKERIKEFLGL